MSLHAVSLSNPSSGQAGSLQDARPKQKTILLPSPGGRIPLTPGRGNVAIAVPSTDSVPAMRDDYIKEAQKVIRDPNILINVVSRRVKQLKRGSRPLVESLEKLAPEDIALREIIEAKISYEIPEN
jgi:DNA-directed RNA polymerase subunit omega